MNNDKTNDHRVQMAKSSRLILWIIGSITAIIGAYYSQFGILFHLKSALLTWFSSWFLAFGWILQTWYYATIDEEKAESSSGIMSLSSNPLMLSDYLMISSLITMALHPVIFISWIIFVKIFMQYMMTGRVHLVFYKIENFTFKIGQYRESGHKLNIAKGLKSSSVTAIFALIILMVVLALRSRVINRALPIEVETGGILLLTVFIFIKIYLTINQKK